MTPNSSKTPDAPRTSCIQCGSCCTKGGPALHNQDMDIMRRGVIMPQHLFTLRVGEKVYENVVGAVVPSQEEMVKIKGKPGSWTCLFF